MPRIRMRWVIPPVPIRPHVIHRNIWTFTYNLHPRLPSSFFCFRPNACMHCTVHLPCSARTSYPPLFVMLTTSSKGTNYDPNIKNCKCLRARHSDWLVPCSPTSDYGVNNKKKNRVYDHRLWSSILGFPHQPELAIQFTTPCTEYTYQFAILHLSVGDFYFPFPPSQISNSK